MEYRTLSIHLEMINVDPVVYNISFASTPNNNIFNNSTKLFANSKSMSTLIYFFVAEIIMHLCDKIPFELKFQNKKENEQQFNFVKFLCDNYLYQS